MYRALVGGFKRCANWSVGTAKFSIFAYKHKCMIYIAIDDSSGTAKKMAHLIKEMPYATVYKEFNKTTLKAFKEIKDGNTIKAKDVRDLLKHLKQ